MQLLAAQQNDIGMLQLMQLSSLLHQRTHRSQNQGRWHCKVRRGLWMHVISALDQVELYVLMSAGNGLLMGDQPDG
jgi:hypothetical protein